MKCLDMPHFTQCGVLLVTDMIEPAVLAAAERQGEAPSAALELLNGKIILTLRTSRGAYIERELSITSLTTFNLKLSS
ncbi:hypothetical protein EC042_pAA015 (plasmid) [Escherichia coli 042]|uniref:Uncharacterized protein n=1 Tax=Escherichia coli O44:H18 (strain 042 / EAEC) TaxID=216592 RepID=D3H5A1_ECO44|nr:hypothetical protein [Escherichia coli]CBG27769.1 hypothetical protein EC042_pAA015 [Escherichia coli 042]EEV9230077.1 hypothetical protein [Escherichia coli]EEW3555992.1 hypothetical protein [Escherichia coli]EEW9498100.1 hypothetical protein [Escherichia coli]